MNASYLFLAATICLFLTSCQSDLAGAAIEEEAPQQRSYPLVEEALWQHFENFELEAAKRNIFADLVRERIRGTIQNIEEANVAGSCSYGGFAPGRIVVDNQFWNRASFLNREMIVFHELGHCFLHRDHLEGRFNNGACISIMRSGSERCIDNYTSGTRADYLDELFSIDNRRGI